MVALSDEVGVEIGFVVTVLVLSSVALWMQ